MTEQYLALQHGQKTMQSESRKEEHHLAYTMLPMMYDGMRQQSSLA